MKTAFFSRAHCKTMNSHIEDSPSATAGLEIGSREKNEVEQDGSENGNKKVDGTPQYQQDAFGDEEFAEVKYKVLKWWYVGRSIN